MFQTHDRSYASRYNVYNTAITKRNCLLEKFVIYKNKNTKNKNDSFMLKMIVPIDMGKSFARWRYRNQWDSIEVRLLLV